MPGRNQPPRQELPKVTKPDNPDRQRLLGIHGPLRTHLRIKRHRRVQRTRKPRVTDRQSTSRWANGRVGLLVLLVRPVLLVPTPLAPSQRHKGLIMCGYDAERPGRRHRRRKLTNYVTALTHSFETNNQNSVYRTPRVLYTRRLSGLYLGATPCGRGRG